MIKMMQFAWENYKKYAWGSNEFRPISRTNQTGIFNGAPNAGATIIDALDTLYIMDLKSEFNDGLEWVKSKFSLDTNSSQSAFEVNIRLVGGLLAVYTLTNEGVND